jgi:hypothetical protein
MQIGIVTAAVVLAGAYLARRLAAELRAPSRKGTGCGGCTGCPASRSSR